MNTYKPSNFWTINTVDIKRLADFCWVLHQNIRCAVWLGFLFIINTPKLPSLFFDNLLCFCSTMVLVLRLNISLKLNFWAFFNPQLSSSVFSFNSLLAQIKSRCLSSKIKNIYWEKTPMDSSYSVCTPLPENQALQFSKVCVLFRTMVLD